MKMVVTLKSGVQIKSSVSEYTVSEGELNGDLRTLKWTLSAEPDVNIQWLDVSQVAAVHTEYDDDGPTGA